MQSIQAIVAWVRGRFAARGSKGNANVAEVLQPEVSAEAQAIARYLAGQGVSVRTLVPGERPPEMEVGDTPLS